MHNLGKGTRWRIPVASPRPMARASALSLIAPLKRFGRFITIRVEPSRSQHIPRGQRVRRRKTTKRLVAEPRAGRSRSSCRPSTWGVLPPQAPRAGLGDFHLHRYRTMEDRYDRSSAIQAEPPSSPKHPMVNVSPLNHDQALCRRPKLQTLAKD